MWQSDISNRETVVKIEKKERRDIVADSFQL